MTLPIKDCVLAMLVKLGSTVQERLAPSLLGHLQHQWSYMPALCSLSHPEKARPLWSIQKKSLF